MKGKQIGILMAVMCLLLTGGAFALTAPVWQTPVAGGTVTGSAQLLNVTAATADETVNLTVDYKTSGGSWTFVGSSLNDTAGDIDLNVTWDTTSVTDQVITLNASTYLSEDGGATFTIIGSAVINVDVQNTVPTSTFGSATLSSGTNTDNTSITIDTATDASIVNCTLTSSPSFTSNATTSWFVAASGSKCIWQIDNIVDNSFGYYFTTVDGLDTSTSATRYVTIDTNNARYVAPEEGVAGEPTKTSSNGFLWILAIAVVGGYIWFKSKK